MDKAIALDVAKRTEEAISAIDQAIKVSRYKPQRFWMQKACILEKLGKADDALACYVKARTLDGKLSAAWRKEAELQRGRDAKAYKEALRKYVELVPVDAQARKELNNND